MEKKKIYLSSKAIRRAALSLASLFPPPGFSLEITRRLTKRPLVLVGPKWNQTEELGEDVIDW